MRTREFVFRNELDLRHALSMLIRSSKWFEVTPYPDDEWRVKVKDETLPEVMLTHGEEVTS